MNFESEQILTKVSTVEEIALPACAGSLLRPTEGATGSLLTRGDTHRQHCQPKAKWLQGDHPQPGNG
jgi:hypothetical protein